MIDVELPKEFTDFYPGPRFGIEGLTDMFPKCKTQPLGAIFKPRLGLLPEECAEMAVEAAIGGADFVKDDEILFNPSFCRLEERVEQVSNSLRVRKRTRIVYFANVSGRGDIIVDIAGKAIIAGASGFYVNCMTTGFFAIRALRNAFDVPIIVGRDMYAPLSLQPDRGISVAVLGKFARICGADFFYVGSAAGKLRNEILEIQRLSDVLRDRHFGFRSTWPLVSCGMYPGNIHLNFGFIGPDIAVQAGGGIHGHPGGTRRGTLAMRTALDLAYSGLGLTFTRSGRRATVLDEALVHWGRDEMREELKPPALVHFQEKNL